MASRGIFSLISLILIAGSLVFMFFILLAGAINHQPPDKFYFLQVDTSLIPGAPPMSRWTFWNICGVGNGVDTCGAVHPAFPLDPPSGRNFGTTDHVPAQFIGTRKYFYMTRFMFAFMLIALFFAVLSFFTGVLALCSRIGSYLSGLLALLAMIFQTANAALMTAAYVIGRNNFRSNGQTADIGKYAFGFEWAAWFCLFLSTVLFCMAGGRKKNDPTEYGTGTGTGTDPDTTTKRRFFSSSRDKNAENRGSFIHSEPKESYS